MLYMVTSVPKKPHYRSFARVVEAKSKAEAARIAREGDPLYFAADNPEYNKTLAVEEFKTDETYAF